MKIILEKAVLINVVGDVFKDKETGKDIPFYKANIFADGQITECKTDVSVFNDIKSEELIKGIAYIEIKKTSYKGVEKTNFILEKFEY